MKHLFFSILCMTIYTCQAQVTKLNLKYFPRELTYRMLINSDSMGYTKVDTEIKAEKIHLYEKTKIKSFEEVTHVYMDKALTLDSVTIIGNANDKKIDCKSVTRQDSVIGYFGYPASIDNNVTDINTKINSNFLERTASLFIIPSNLDFNQKQTSVIQYNPTDGKFRDIIIKVEDVVSISVPAGVFKSYKITFTGGLAKQIFYVDKKSLKIVKITFQDNPWIYELL